MAHFTIDIEVTEEDFDERGYLKADRIFQFFQNASEGHVNSLGVGPDDLIKRDYIWVLTKMHVKFTDRAAAGTPAAAAARRYICTTYPVRQKRATFKRDYYINYAEDGPDPDKALVIGASQWCILNFKTRKLEKTDIVFESAPDEKDMIEGVFPKIRGNDPQFVQEHQVNARDLDYNDHCNNTVYIRLAEEATGKPIREDLYVNFASETRFGETFKLFSETQTEEQGTKTYVEGRREDESIVFQIVFK